MIKLFLPIIIAGLCILQGCSEQKEDNDKPEDNSKILIDRFLEDLKSTKKSFKYILRKYYYEPETILRSEEYLIVHTKSYYNLVKCIKNPSFKVNFYFNEEVDNAKYYDYSWLDDNGDCTDYLLVLVSDEESNYVTDFRYCFNEDGQIYSGLNIIDPSDNTTIWLRSQEEYLNKDEDGSYYIGI